MSFAGICSTGRYMIDKPCPDSAAQNRVIPRGLQCLGHRHAAIFLNGLEPARAVAAGAREHDAHGVLPAILGQRTEETINRGALAPRLDGRRYLQVPSLIVKVALGGMI